MPSSRPAAIPAIISLLRQIRPGSILDVGIGFGKWGILFREYTDILASEAEPARYHRAGWKVVIDGIEGFPRYIGPHQQYIYNNIFIGDAMAVMKGLKAYDFIFVGDVIEHFQKADGAAFIEEALKHANRYIILSTPAHETHQGALCENVLETHRSLWCERDFVRLGNCRVTRAPGDILLAQYAVGTEPFIPFEKVGLLGVLRSLAFRLGFG